jgi:NADH:ubiquinone oxidoreductase subunit F (NADH-binding)/(2Fe-2S) ferredoxin
MENIEEIAEQEKNRQQEYSCRVFCCTSTACESSGSSEVVEAITEAVKAHEITDQVQIVKTGCMGLCSEGPLVRVEVSDAGPVLYKEVGPLVARLIVVEHIARAINWDRDTPFEIPEFLKNYTFPLDSTFFTGQEKIVLANAGAVDPENIDQYIARGGYAGLKKVLTEMTPEQLIDEIKKSGLRGRGGAGFPTGLKWANTRSNPGDLKYVVCNGDEGDPGAYMDRSILEADPHAVLEGMIIAGFAVGAESGWFYIRVEYPLAVSRLEKAIKAAKKRGLLGENILKSGFSFDCEIRLGAGAFVCGEETALIASIEGKRGTPRPRPPYPSEKGLWDKPTCVNNVETLANVPHILRNGCTWFSSMGTETSKGTKVFALTGKTVNTGLIEVPMGTEIRTIIEEIGGGMATEKPLKAVQTGGPSGGVIPLSMLDSPVCYDKLEELGSIMGSGGMITLDEDDSMVDIAAFYLDFTVDESCGKCAPCRIGGFQLLGLLEKIAAGNGTKKDLAKVRRIAQAMTQASLCGLGQTAPNPVLSTLRYFENEYLDLLKEEVSE